MTILKTQNLTKRFGNFTALSDVSIALERGHIYGFVGNNGAGKTTFMRLVCGLISPTAGTVELFGETTPRGLEQAREKVGALIEQPIFYPEMSARQNLRSLSMLNRNSNFREVEELMELVGILPYAKRAVGKYSTGMQKRYGLAAAMLGNPDFLILDEPMSGVDVDGMDDITAILKTLVREKGVTVLFSSHQLARLEQIATDYIFIDGGRIIKVGDAATIAKEVSETTGGIEPYFRKLRGGGLHDA